MAKLAIRSSKLLDKHAKPGSVWFVRSPATFESFGAELATPAKFVILVSSSERAVTCLNAEGRLETHSLDFFRNRCAYAFSHAGVSF